MKGLTAVIPRLIVLVVTAIFYPLLMTMNIVAARVVRYCAGCCTRFEIGRQYDVAAIVVPTAGLERDAYGAWRPSYQTRRRVEFGLKVQSQTGLPMIIVGGVRERDGPAESEVAAAENKLSGPNIIVESTAKNSAETGQVVAAIMATSTRWSCPSQARPCAILVTSHHHIPRMAATLRSNGLEVVTAPVDSHSMPAFAFLLDVPRAFRELALRECLGIAWYLVRRHFTLSDLLAWRPKEPSAGAE